MDQLRLSEWADRRMIRIGVIALAVVLFAVWILYTPSGVFGKADAIGYAVCHKIDGRSFHIGDRQLPLCVRCSGQFLGAMFGLLFLGAIGRRRIGSPPMSVVLVLFLFVIAYAIDGVNSYFHLSPMMEMFPGFPRLYEPSNMMRLFTGSGMGFAVVVLLLPAFNRTVWLFYDRKPVIDDIKQLGNGLLFLFLLDLLILTENPIFLYPLSIISALGVLILLTMVYSLAVTMVFRLENRSKNLIQLVLPLTAGFILALIQIGILDAIRYLLTGTWEGFHL